MKAQLAVAAVCLLGSCVWLRAEQTPYGKLNTERYYKQLLPLQEKDLGKDSPALLPTLKGYLEVVGPDGLQKRNVADSLTKHIHSLETAEGKQDESPKGSKATY